MLVCLRSLSSCRCYSNARRGCNTTSASVRVSRCLRRCRLRAQVRPGTRLVFLFPRAICANGVRTRLTTMVLAFLSPSGLSFGKTRISLSNVTGIRRSSAAHVNKQMSCCSHGIDSGRLPPECNTARVPCLFSPCPRATLTRGGRDESLSQLARGT